MKKIFTILICLLIASPAYASKELKKYLKPVPVIGGRII